MTFKMAVALVGVLGMMAWLAPGCAADGGEDDCSPGEQESCACPGGEEGIRACEGDRHEFGSCYCPVDEGLTKAECSELKINTTSCYDDYCSGTGAGTTFCGCWSAGQDMTFSCECAPLNLDSVCTGFDAAGLEASQFDCPASQQIIDSLCSTS